MTALAEVVECLAGDVRLLNRERFNHDTGSAKKHVALAFGIRLGLAFHH